LQVEPRKGIYNPEDKDNRKFIVGITFAVFVVILCISQFLQAVGMIGAAFFKFDNVQEELVEMIENIETSLDGDLMSWGALIGGLISLFLCLWVEKKSGFGKGSILSFKLPETKHWFIWIGAAFAYTLVMFQIEQRTDLLESPFMENVLNSITNLPIAILGIGIVVPIFEEMLFRGFLLKGLKDAWGGHIAVWVSSIIFVIVHGAQYEPILLLILLPLALILGYSRLYSKSLIVPIVIHVLNNSLAFL